MPKIGIGGTGNIDHVQMDEQASTPSTPGAGKSAIFLKSDGLYVIDDAGSVTGPLATSSGFPSFSGAILTKSAAQSVNSATSTAVTFDGEVVDTDTYHDNATNNTRLTAPSTGYYMVGGSAEFDSLDDQKSAIMWIRKGGADADGDGRARIFNSSSAGAGFPNPFFGRPVQLNASEYVELMVNHNHGSARNIRTSANGTSFWIFRIA